jgi:hypothetical protein
MKRERRPTHSLSQKDRLPYGAVPFAPWTAVERSGAWPLRGKSETYLSASTRRIHNRVSDAMTDATNDFQWVDSPELAEVLRDMIEVSLFDSQCRRIERNPDISGLIAMDQDDKRIEKAKNGTASPAELLTLLLDYPELHSLEIAKLSHPLDASATETMDGEVLYTLAYLGFDVIPEAGRYKMKTNRSEIPAATVLRKQTMASLETPHGVVEIVQRKAFLVRGDAEARAEVDHYPNRMVKNENRHTELFEAMEALTIQPGGEPTPSDRKRKWLQPLATSYYAKYVERTGTPEKSLDD